MHKQIIPKWTIEQAIQIGKEAIKLVEDRRREIEPRVSPGVLDALPSDIAQLEALSIGRPAKVVEVKGLTGTEAEIAKRGAAWVSAVREAVRKRAKGSGLAKAVGVGTQVYSGNSKSVTSAMEAILTAAAENPDGMHACGILDLDIQNGQAIFDALVNARNNQDLGMKDKKDLTTEKNIIQLRIEKAIAEISTAGYIQLMETEPVIALRFKALPPSTATRKIKTTGQETPIKLPRKEKEVTEKAS